MNPHPTRITDTRHTGTPLSEPPDSARYTPKRRKSPTPSDRTSMRELLCCLVAVGAMLAALAVVAPHLDDTTAPSPDEWAILLALLAVLGAVCYLGSRTPRR